MTTVAIQKSRLNFQFYIGSVPGGIDINNSMYTAPASVMLTDFHIDITCIGQVNGASDNDEQMFIADWHPTVKM